MSFLAVSGSQLAVKCVNRKMISWQSEFKNSNDYMVPRAGIEPARPFRKPRILSPIRTTSVSHWNHTNQLKIHINLAFFDLAVSVEFRPFRGCLAVNWQSNSHARFCLCPDCVARVLGGGA